MCRKPITIDECHHKSSSRQQLWIADLNLEASDRESLLSPTGWLNGRTVSAAQQLLKKQFVWATAC